MATYKDFLKRAGETSLFRAKSVRLANNMIMWKVYKAKKKKIDSDLFHF